MRDAIESLPCPYPGCSAPAGSACSDTGELHYARAEQIALLPRSFFRRHGALEAYLYIRGKEVFEGPDQREPYERSTDDHSKLLKVMRRRYLRSRISAGQLVYVEDGSPEIEVRGKWGPA